MLRHGIILARGVKNVPKIQRRTYSEELTTVEAPKRRFNRKKFDYDFSYKPPKYPISFVATDQDKVHVMSLKIHG